MFCSCLRCEQVQQEVMEGGALMSESGRLINARERSPSDSPAHRSNPRASAGAGAASSAPPPDAADGLCRPGEQEADSDSDSSPNGLDLVLKTAGIFLWRHSYLLVLICMTVRCAPAPLESSTWHSLRSECTELTTSGSGSSSLFTWTRSGSCARYVLNIDKRHIWLAYLVNARLACKRTQTCAIAAWLALRVTQCTALLKLCIGVWGASACRVGQSLITACLLSSGWSARARCGCCPTRASTRCAWRRWSARTRCSSSCCSTRASWCYACPLWPAASASSTTASTRCCAPLAATATTRTRRPRRPPPPLPPLSSRSPPRCSCHWLTTARTRLAAQSRARALLLWSRAETRWPARSASLRPTTSPISPICWASIRSPRSSSSRSQLRFVLFVALLKLASSRRVLMQTVHRTFHFAYIRLILIKFCVIHATKSSSLSSFHYQK